MSIAAQSTSQSQTIHINNNLSEWIVGRGPIITVPVVLYGFYRVFMHGMNNSMDNFSQKGKHKSANSTHKWKLAVSIAVFIIIILVVFCLKK